MSTHFTIPRVPFSVALHQGCWCLFCKRQTDIQAAPGSEAYRQILIWENNNVNTYARLSQLSATLCNQVPLE